MMGLSIIADVKPINCRWAQVERIVWRPANLQRAIDSEQHRTCPNGSLLTVHLSVLMAMLPAPSNDLFIHAE